MALTSISASAVGPTAGSALTEQSKVIKLQSADWGDSRVIVEASATDANYAPVLDQSSITHLGPQLGERPGVFPMVIPSGWFVRINVKKYGGTAISVSIQ